MEVLNQRTYAINQDKTDALAAVILEINNLRSLTKSASDLNTSINVPCNINPIRAERSVAELTEKIAQGDHLNKLNQHLSQIFTTQNNSPYQITLAQLCIVLDKLNESESFIKADFPDRLRFYGRFIQAIKHNEMSIHDKQVTPSDILQITVAEGKFPAFPNV